MDYAAAFLDIQTKQRWALFVARKPDKAVEAEAPPGVVLVTEEGERLNVKHLRPDGSFPATSNSRVGWFTATNFVDRLPPGWEAICGDFASFLVAQRLSGSPDREALANAIASYRHRRLLELEGAEERDVQEALQTISRSVNRLLSITRPGGPDAKSYNAAWRRIAGMKAPYETGERDPEDELYPVLTLIRSRLAAAQRDRRVSVAPSMAILVERLAGLVRQAGGRATTSSGIVRSDGPEISTFVGLVKAALDRAAMPPPCSMTDRGLTQAVATALKART